MLQITQNYKTGELKLEEVPFPQLAPNKMLVRTEYSVISSGTEGMKIRQAKMSLLGKVQARPDQVKKVIENIKKEGLLTTYKKVMRKLDSLTPLGYSSAGEIIAVGSEVHGFSVGDRVACGGQEACHAEVEAVFPNLCVKVPDNVPMKYAAFTTIGAIALQGIRRADVHLGEIVAVIGLGLIGQLTVQMLKATGCVVVGADIEKEKIDLAKKVGVFAVDVSDLKSQVDMLTEGNGVDAVIITAASSSNEPIELAGEILRKRGRVVIVGAVPTNFSRENYYKKELDLRMSCSYGPGRYDKLYEEKGIDYPYGYVRWTEKRNMEAFLKMLAEERIDLSPIITHVFKFQNALEAYKLIEERKEFYVGILLEYDRKKELKKDVILIQRRSKKEAKVVIGMIGAGSFARNYILPYLRKQKDIEFRAILTGSGLSAKDVAVKFGFQKAVSEADCIFNDRDINLVIVATRHNLHASYVTQALKSKKSVFVEKPLAINREELREIVNLYNTNPEVKFLVGFNRRFAPMAKEVKQFVANGKGPIFFQARINAGYISPDHWIQDVDIGGGRIVGEVCHFVDLARFWIGSPVKSVFAVALPIKSSQQKIADSLQIVLTYADGSIASIQYLSNGSSLISKEYFEVYVGGKTVILNDFKMLLFADSRKKKKIRSFQQNKGHQAEMESLVNCVKNGLPFPIPPEEIFETTKVTFAIMDSLRLGKRILLE